MYLILDYSPYYEYELYLNLPNPHIRWRINNIWGTRYAHSKIMNVVLVGEFLACLTFKD